MKSKLVTFLTFILTIIFAFSLTACRGDGLSCDCESTNTEKYIVVFDSRGGSAVDNIIDIAFGSKIERPSDPRLDGSSFAGWYREKHPDLSWDFDANSITENTVLFAKWTTDKEVESIEILTKAFYYTTEGKFSIPVRVLPEDATDKVLDFSVGNTDIAEINDLNFLSLNLGKTGIFTLTATANNGISATKTIEVKDVVTLPQLPITVSRYAVGAGGLLSSAQINNMTRTWDAGSSHMSFTYHGVKTYSQMDGNWSIMIDIKIFDKDYNLVHDDLVVIRDALAGESFIYAEPSGFEIDYSKVPYQIQISGIN